MLIREFVDEGLGNMSNLVASEETGQAAVIDPERDVDRYVQVAGSVRQAPGGVLPAPDTLAAGLWLRRERRRHW